MENKRSIKEVAEEGAKSFLETLSGKDITNSEVRIADNVIAFASAAGGAGASTICANLAVQFKKMGKMVIIVDTHTLYPAQYNFFGVKQSEVKDDVCSLLLGKSKLNASIVGTNGASLMYANNRTFKDVITLDQGDIVDRLVQAIEELRHLYDIVLIDTDINLMLEMTNTVLYEANRIYLVWDEDINCLANTERLRNAMGMCGIDFGKVKCVMNKRSKIRYPMTPIKALGLDLVSVLPFSLSIIESGLSGQIFVEKGVSFDNTAGVFCDGIVRLAQYIIVDGGGQLDK